MRQVHTLLILAMSFTSIAFAGNEGKGGGGLDRNGRLVTFQTAGVTVKVDPLTDVPELMSLDQVVQKMPLPNTTKQVLYANYMISGARQYFSISEDQSYKLGEAAIKVEYV